DSVRQYRTGVNRRIVGLSVGDPISSDCIEVLERQSRWIDYAMTLAAGRLVAMRLQTLTHRRWRFACFLSKILVLYCWRRRCRRRSLDATQYPRPTKDRRRAVGIRSSHQDCGLAEQSKTLLVGEFHLSELCTSDSLDPVVLRQALVDECGLRRQQIHHAV